MDLSGIPKEWLALALAGVTALAAFQAGVAWLSRYVRRRRILSRLTRAGEGEKYAAEFLRHAGFDILGTQVASRYELIVDGAPVTIEVRADLIVERARKRFVVEVKTGKLAPRLETAATRRQLLEYQLAFEAEGVLLFDAEASALRTVTFPQRDLAPNRGWSWFALGTLLVLAMLGFLFERR